MKRKEDRLFSLLVKNYLLFTCLLYTSPSPGVNICSRDREVARKVWGRGTLVCSTVFLGEKGLLGMVRSMVSGAVVATSRQPARSIRLVRSMAGAASRFRASQAWSVMGSQALHCSGERGANSVSPYSSFFLAAICFHSWV